MEPTVGSNSACGGLTALEEGVKGGVGFSLVDKLCTPRGWTRAWERVRANRGADHQRRPNAYFAREGLFTMREAYRLACPSGAAH